jgi:predicted permease
VNLHARLRSFIAALVARRRLERDMDREWRFHVDERAAALVAAGASRTDAEARARLEFGDALRWREQGREARGLRLLQDIRSDVHYALRQMRRAPAFAIVAITTLALGIGANTAMFSIANALMLRPLPIREPHRLFAVGTPNDIDELWPYAVWEEVRARAQPFDGSLAFGRQRFDLSERGESEPVEGIYASGDFFEVLGVPALIGRTFTSADDVPGVGAGPDGPVAVISYRFWQRRFGGAEVIGQSLRIQRATFTIIGVTPPEFFGADVGRSFDVALPLNSERLVRGGSTVLTRESTNYFIRIMLRLRTGQPVDAAEALLRGMQAQIREASMPPLPPDYQAQYLKDPFTLVPASGGISSLRAQYATPLTATIAIVGIVLLIACANLANLLLARATARRHELSVRLALGAGRWRLARQVFVETLLLAAAGAALGLLLAVGAGELLVSQLSTVDNPVALDLRVDRTVLAFTTFATLATSFLFGVVPAWRSTRLSPGDTLREQGRGVAGRAGMSRGLVVAQVALSLVLVVAAGLFVRTLLALSRLDLGFESRPLLIANVDLARSPIAPANRAAFVYELVERVGAVPRVASAAASRVTPIGGGGIIDEVEVLGGPPVTTADMPYGVPRFWNVNSAMLNIVTPGWFATYGMTLRRGRDFTRQDVSASPPVGIVNEAFARRFLYDRDPIGASVVHRIGSLKGTARTVVGVVNDAVYDSLRGGVRPVLFVPLEMLQGGGPPTIPLTIRAAAGPPAALSSAVAATLSSREPSLAFSFRPLQERVDATFTHERVLAMLSAFFGALALLLAGVGLYGVTAYSVARRRSEIGIRLALGAGPRRVVRQVLGSVFVLMVIGVIVGASASVWLTRFVAGLLYGLEPNDPATLAASAMILAGVGAVAGWLPAYRASRIDPAQVLREN